MLLADVRYQIFLSSTYEDLRLERQQATQTILEMGHMPAGMELFPASDLSQWELIKRVIDESDYYVIIVGGRYGSVHSDTGISFTEMEYDYATSVGIPVLGFVRRDPTSVAAKYYEQDPQKKEKLDAFRGKVTNKICRLYDEPSDLGMLVMKSLMSETRINPRIGWVRADQARGEEDVAREKQLISELSSKDKQIKSLERKLRDRSLPLAGYGAEDLEQGSDILSINATFNDSAKNLLSQDIEFTWDEVFSVIGPQMYGYIVRRPRDTDYGSYSFENGLIEYIRSKIFSTSGNRQIKLLPHEIDGLLIQFQQLGLVEMQEKDQDTGEVFRGYSLTRAREEHLLRVRVRPRQSNKGIDPSN